MKTIKEQIEELFNERNLEFDFPTDLKIVVPYTVLYPSSEEGDIEVGITDIDVSYQKPTIGRNEYGWTPYEITNVSYSFSSVIGPDGEIELTPKVEELLRDYIDGDVIEDEINKNTKI